MHAQMPEGSVQVVILFQSNFAVWNFVCWSRSATPYNWNFVCWSRSATPYNWNFVCASREGIQPDMLLYLYMGATMPGTSGRMMCC